VGNRKEKREQAGRRLGGNKGESLWLWGREPDLPGNTLEFPINRPSHRKGTTRTRLSGLPTLHPAAVSGQPNTSFVSVSVSGYKTRPSPRSF
jgi:hypothetical protein